MTHHRLYQLLLEHMYGQKTFKDAELNIKMLHDALICSIKHREGENYVPSEGEVWEEVKLFMKWDGKLIGE